MEVSSDIASYNEYLEVVWRLAVEADQVQSDFCIIKNTVD